VAPMRVGARPQSGKNGPVVDRSRHRRGRLPGGVRRGSLVWLQRRITKRNRPSPGGRRIGTIFPWPGRAAVPR